MEELFEFDLSDVDVAAFENVASTPPQSTSPTPQLTSIPEAPTILSDGKDLSQTEETIEATTTTITAPTTETNTVTLAHLTASASSEPVTLTTTTASPTITTLATSQQHTLTTHLHQQQHHQQQQHIHINQQQQQQQLQHHVSHLATATGPQSRKILLIPLNSSTKQGTQGITHLIQLPPGASPMTVSALKNASGNKKQVLQFAPKNDNIFHQQPQRPATPTPQMIANEVPKRKPCNCTKSQCLKLYCDCFANGEFCSGCNCTNCFNSLSKEKERQKAITQCLERNPEAFRPKIGKAIKSSQGEPAPESIERRHTKGCNCKRSGCLKNYCECYEAKILCSNLCKCCGCKNYEESFERKTLMQLANSSSESARGILKNLLPTNNGALGGKEFTKSFITDSVIRASLQCLLQSAQQAEKDGMPADNIQNLIQVEMGKCLRMIVDSASESSSAKRR